VKRFSKLGAAFDALTFAVIPASTPASAYDYCYRQVASYMLSCSFDTMAQCTSTAFGLGGDCFRDPFTREISSAYGYARSPARTKSLRKGSAGPLRSPSFFSAFSARTKEPPGI
jgi:Protein of unknown function (DUF3551)